MEPNLITPKKAMLVGFFALTGPLFAQELDGSIPVFSQTYLGQPSSLNLNGDTIGDQSSLQLIEQAPEELTKAGLSSRVHLRQKSFEGLNLTN